MEINNSKLEKLMEKAKSHCKSNDFKKAIDCFDKVLQIDPKHK